MTIARRYRSGRLKDLTPFKLDADGMPVNMRKFKPPAKLAPPPTRKEWAAVRRKCSEASVGPSKQARR